MAQLSSEFKRGLLRGLYRAAVAGGISLETALISFQDARFEQVKSGRIVTSHSANGHSTAFALPSSFSQLQPEQCFCLSEEFLAVLETVKAASPAGTDADWFAAMLLDDRLQGVTRYTADFTLMNAASGVSR